MYIQYVMKILMNFLFGKFPKIFTKKGEIQHDLSPHSWKNWKRRYKEGIEYNWKQHKGKRHQSHSSHNSVKLNSNKTQNY